MIGLDAVYSGAGILRIVKALNLRKKHLWWLNTDYCESYMRAGDLKAIKEIKRFKPVLFCINASDTNDSEVNLQIKIFMQEMFPLPSKFEKV